LGRSSRPLGYYLGTAVLAYVLWRQLRTRNPLIADLSTMAAVGYALPGGVGAAVLAMVAPMLMHAYTDAIAAGQALIAAQFAVVLQVVWRAIWQFLDAIHFAAWWLGLDGSSAPIIAADPLVAGARRCGSSRGPPPTSPLSISYAMFYSACSSRYGPRGGSRCWWCLPANRNQPPPPLPHHDRRRAVVPLSAATPFVVFLLWP
jgi:hypothetical protein